MEFFIAMKKIKVYGMDIYIPEDKQEHDSINAVAEVQGHAILLHFGKILRQKTINKTKPTNK